MSIVRSTGVFIGTSESAGITMEEGDVITGSEVDLLADNTSIGNIHLYFVATPKLDGIQAEIILNGRRLSGQNYISIFSKTVYLNGVSGVQKLYLGICNCSRYMNVIVKNETYPTSSRLTNVAVLYELEKIS